MLRILEAREVPPFYRNLLIRTLSDPEVEVGVWDRASAIATKTEDLFEIADGVNISRNEGYSEVFDSAYPWRAESPPGEDFVPAKLNLILLQTENVSEADQFVALIHELAHVAFERYFASNLAELMAVLPPGSITRSADGSFEVESQIRSFLHERFAHEFTYYAIDPIVREEFGRVPDALVTTTYDWSGYPIRVRIPFKDAVPILTKRTLENYGYTHPVVKRLAKCELIEILQGRCSL